VAGVIVRHFLTNDALNADINCGGSVHRSMSLRFISFEEINAAIARGINVLLLHFVVDQKIRNPYRFGNSTVFKRLSGVGVKAPASRLDHHQRASLPGGLVACSADTSRYVFYSCQPRAVARRLERPAVPPLRSAMQALVVALSVVAVTPASAATDACHGDPFSAAAAIYQLDPDLLRAITWVESRGIPGAVGPRLSGGHRAWGAAQINDIHLPELVSYGVTRSDLLDPCINLKLSAWVLANCIRSKGATWAAVGCYNAGPASSNTAAQAKYVRLVQHAYAGYRAQSAAAMSAIEGAK
jgi:hypothetical protein